MWHRKYIDWNNRELIGYPEKLRSYGKDRGKKEDFAEQAAVYALYNNNNECVYVGQAGKGEKSALFDRLKEHALDDELFCLWERFTWYGFYSVDALIKNTEKAYDDEFDVETDINELMNVMESLLIRTSLPRYNFSRGSLKKEKGKGVVEWYYQLEEYEDRLNEN